MWKWNVGLGGGWSKEIMESIEWSTHIQESTCVHVKDTCSQVLVGIFELLSLLEGRWTTCMI